MIFKDPPIYRYLLKKIYDFLVIGSSTKYQEAHRPISYLALKPITISPNLLPIYLQSNRDNIDYPKFYYRYWIPNNLRINFYPSSFWIWWPQKPINLLRKNIFILVWFPGPCIGTFQQNFLVEIDNCYSAIRSLMTAFLSSFLSTGIYRIIIGCFTT